MARRLVVQCPAKINRFLKIFPPDPYGFHPLETEFQAVGLYDTLTVMEGGEGFAVEGADLPAENTLTRTLRLMREVASLPKVGLTLVKRIPTESGLGGGSSDAAGLLRAFRALLPGVVPDRDFLTVAKTVGADVPFFLVGGAAHATGYGEILTPLPDSEKRWMVLARPFVSCPTGPMFAALDAYRATSASPLPPELATNDFHSVAPAECLELLDQLRRAGLTEVAMTGSGSVVFGYATDEAEAGRLAATFRTAWAVPTLSRAESLVVTTTP